MSETALATTPPPPVPSAWAGAVRRGAWGWTALALGCAALVGLPVVTVGLNLFAPSTELWRHLASTVLPGYIANSLWLMLGVGFGVVVGGVASAWLVTMCRFPGSRTLEWALLLPMAMPAYVVAYAYTGLLDVAGPVQSALRTAFGWQSAAEYRFPEVRSLGGAIVVMSLVFYPYVYIMARAAFLEQSVCVLEAARVLGRGPWRAFRQVALPLARPAIAGGVALALMETLNDFGTVQYFAVDTFTTGIYRTWIGLGEPAMAAQLGALLMLFVLALLVMDRLSRRAARFHHTTGRYRSLPELRLRGGKALLALLFCLVPMAFGFAVPGGVLAWWAVEAGGSMLLGGEFWTLAANTLTLATVTGLLAVALAVVLGYARRLHPSALVQGTSRLAAMGYAIPGSVIAVGTLVPLAALDHALSALLRDRFGWSGGMLLTGSVAALVYAYLVRFLAVSFNGVEAGLAKISPSMDAAARTLGQRPAGALRRVHLPILRGSLLSAALLVFVEVMKELPATLIVRPFNFDTLATRTYTLASDERLAEAGAPALAIVLVGLIPVMLLSRAIARSRPGAAVLP
jgi:iron(III) transport system permease protein